MTDTTSKRPVPYCKCAFTDPDGTFVPGEACQIHPDVKPQREAPTKDENLTPEDEAMLDRCMSHFYMVTAMYRMGLGEQMPPHPVTDEQYQRALQQPETPDEF